MLEFQNICFGVQGKPIILDKINFTINDGETVVITGPNGGGKTTLAKIIAGIYQPTSGEILLNGEDVTGFNITERAKKGIAYAFQQPVRFKGMTTRDLIELASGRTLARDEVFDLLRRVGLPGAEYIDRDVDSKLSGGEIKRIEIATVMARSKDASLFVFDEPEAGIDLWSFSNLIEVFANLRQKESDSIVVISHQERILKVADRIAVIAQGKLAAFDKAEIILPRLSEGVECRECGGLCLAKEEEVL